jgi:hypothetical protein
MLIDVIIEIIKIIVERVEAMIEITDREEIKTAMQKEITAVMKTILIKIEGIKTDQDQGLMVIKDAIKKSLRGLLRFRPKGLKILSKAR